MYDNQYIQPLLPGPQFVHQEEPSDPPHPQELSQDLHQSNHNPANLSIADTNDYSPVPVLNPVQALPATLPVQLSSVQYPDTPNQLPETRQLSTANLARLLDPDARPTSKDTHNPVRVRRRLPPGSDHVKHKRTRSGCYTCRSRRVKCDETHPICDRCRKGSRECVYPEPTSATQSTPGSKLGQHRKSIIEAGSSEEEYEDEESPGSPMGAPKSGIKDLRLKTSTTSLSNSRDAMRKQSQPASNQNRTGSVSQDHLKESSLSPSTDSSYISQSRSGSTARIHSGKLSNVSTNTSLDDSPWSYLPQDLRLYLDFHRNFITHRHYLLKHDASSFVHTTLLNIALEYDPLLYAVVGFAAFQHTVQKPNGKISDFLGYYNRSVSLLRKSLQTSQKRTDATILTILQLAAFEEYLGDWVNLIGHQKAAYEMLRELYSPDTVMQSETSRKILSWYARFDVFASLMAGNATTLSTEWFRASENWYANASRENPEDSDLRLDALFARNKVVGVEMAELFAKLPKGEISIQDFMQENELLGRKIEAGRRAADPLLNMPEHKVYSFEGAPSLPPDNIVDPYQPGMMLKGPLFDINYMLMDWYAIEAMHQYQTSMVLQQPPPPDSLRLALEQCRIIESIDCWPGSPPGSLLPAQASLALACLLVPKEERYVMWCRRKLAKIESQGYIFPLTFRAKMAELWSEPSCTHWWLPNDTEYPPIIRSIRSFIEDRIMKVRTQEDEDVRSIKAMFSKLSHDDSPKDSPESGTNTIDSGFGGPKYGSISSDGTRDDFETHFMKDGQQNFANMAAISNSVTDYPMDTSVDFDTATVERIVEWDVTHDNEHPELYSPLDSTGLRP